MHNNDRLRRQLETGVEFLDGRVVPGLDLAEIDPGEGRAIESEFSRLNAFQVDHRHHAAHDGRELGEAVLVELGLAERHVARPEGYGFGLDLLNAATGA